MTKAKYYVEHRGWTSEKNHALKWHGVYEADSRTEALRVARLDATDICQSDRIAECLEWFPHKKGEPIHKLGVRIRHQGRTLARWQDGRRVGK